MSKAQSAENFGITNHIINTGSGISASLLIGFVLISAGVGLSIWLSAGGILPTLKDVTQIFYQTSQKNLSTQADNIADNSTNLIDLLSKIETNLITETNLLNDKFDRIILTLENLNTLILKLNPLEIPILDAGRFIDQITTTLLS